MHPRSIIFSAALLVGAIGCERDNGVETSVEEVRDWPAAYLGKSITAVGEVERVYPSGAFTLDGKGTWWDDEILVVVPREQATAKPLERRAEVRVTGEVEELVVMEIEREYGLDFEAELESEYQEQPILIARNLVVLEAD